MVAVGLAKDTALAILVERGLDLVFQEKLRPMEAATRLIASTCQFNEAELLGLVRSAVADQIEVLLSRQERVPRFDIVKERTASRIPVQQADIQRLTVLAVEAKSKLDRIYASQGGAMKPLKEFTVADHDWRAATARAQEDTWAKFAAFHESSAAVLRKAGATVIADLPAIDRNHLERLIP